jgi:hypothetical protein
MKVLQEAGRKKKLEDFARNRPPFWRSMISKTSVLTKRKVKMEAITKCQLEFTYTVHLWTAMLKVENYASIIVSYR